MFPCKSHEHGPGPNPWTYPPYPPYWPPYGLYGAYPPAYPPMPYCPFCGQPTAPEPPPPPPCRVIVPQEMWLDPAAETKTIFIGGAAKVRLTLEYMKVTGAASPKVSTTITGQADWSDAAITTDGYHVKNDFALVDPGASVTVTVAEVVARLRWCEQVEC